MRKISVTIVTDSTEDEKNRPRSKVDHRDELLSASARASPAIVSAGTVRRTK